VTLASACSSSIADQRANAPPPLDTHPLHIPSGPRHAVRVPDTVRHEHERIHSALGSVAKVAGPVGDAARELTRVLRPHFEREEQIALPPLGLLAPLAAGEFSPEMASVLPMTDALRAELPQMLSQHREIAAATRHLERVSMEAGQEQAAALAREIALHAKSEEEVFYPAAILLGEVVRARARDQGASHGSNGSKGERGSSAARAHASMSTLPASHESRH
jgi:hypothetical protein